MALTLVTGAFGFIGSHVVRQLLARGDQVAVLARDASRTEALDGQGLEVRRGDLRDRRAVRRALRDVERLFHVAGTTNLRLGREEMFALNVEATRILFEEALGAGVERVIYTSSVAAVGPAPVGKVADENNVWDAGRHRIAYVDAKHEAEVAALRLAGRGLPLVIVNPAHVLGAGDPGRSSTTLVGRFLYRQIPAYVDGTLNVVGVDDVARGHLLADERGAVGERYILGNRNFTLQRLFADLARLSGVEPPAVRLRLPVALALAEAGRRVPGMHVPSAEEVRASALNWAFSSAKAKRELGWSPGPHEDCVEETIAYYREREGERLARAGTRQPMAARVGGRLLRISRLASG